MPTATRILSLFMDADETYSRTDSLHPRFGLLTVVDWTEFFLLHEAHHLYTMLYALVHPTSNK